MGKKRLPHLAALIAILGISGLFSSPALSASQADSAGTGSSVHLGRAVWEDAIFTAVLGVIYRLDLKTNKPDWVFGLNWHDQTRRLWISRWVYDANDFIINFRHVPQGIVNYLIARSNGLNLLESFLFGAAASFVWEAVPEYHEEISINDMIHTPWAGFVLGENFFLLGKYFRSRNLGQVGRILAWLVDPLSGLNGLLDGRASTTQAKAPPYPSDAHVGLSLVAGAERISDRASTAGMLGVEWSHRFVPEPTAAPGNGGDSLRNPLGADFDMGFLVYPGGRMGISISSQILIAGHVSPNRFYYGLASALDFAWSDRPGWTDRLLSTDLAGPAGGFVLIRRDFRLEASAALYGHFSMVRPSGLEGYLLTHDLQGANTALRQSYYYFAWGPSARARFLCRYKAFELAGGLTYRDFISIGGHDRYPKAVTNDFACSDTRTSWRVSAGISLAENQALAFVAAEGLRRWGRMDTVANSRSFVIFDAGLTFYF
jgi:hypothetical protein